MNNIYLSEEAQNDLMEIKAYIENELLNPSAALATVNRITKSLRILRTYAQAGARLSSVADIETDYRFTISGNYISFYRVYDKDVYVDRILYARCNYMRILFGDISTEDLTTKPLAFLQAALCIKICQYLWISTVHSLIEISNEPFLC